VPDLPKNHRSPSSAVAPGGDNGRDSAASAEAQWRRVTARTLRIGLWVWPSFFALDVYMARVVFPGTPLARFATYRLIEEALLLLVYILAQRSAVPARVVKVLNSLAYVLAATLISVMAMSLGGLTSDYMHGLSIVILVDATTRPGPWRQSLRSLIPTAISFPVVMAVALLYDPALGSRWLALASIEVFIAKYVFVVASVVVGAVAAQTVWTAQQQVYAARRLGRYRLQAPIGRGGMNEVWLAWDATLRRSVALKILRNADDSDPHELARFEREARAASTLSSPHTIRIFDFGASDDGVHYIAMEYLSGADLAAVVKSRGPMPPGRVVHIGRQACESLAEAHERGIVHRDIKPHNLFLTRVGHEWDFVKLLDFGIAHLHEPGEVVTQTRTGTIKGTPTYMAPEVCAGGHAVAASDIYSLGATLYFLLAGVPPFAEGSLARLMFAHQYEPPAPPSLRRGAALPGPLEEAVMRCLAKRPQERFASVVELAVALAAAAAASPWTADDARACWPASFTGHEATPRPPSAGGGIDADRSAATTIVV
jgi:eukaryotic-like serine/threonine-protein kinase